MTLDNGHQMAHADAGHEDHDIDVPRDQFIGELDDVGTVGQRHFAHRGAHKRLAAVAVNQSLRFLGAATLESQHPKSIKILYVGNHTRHRTARWPPATRRTRGGPRTNDGISATIKAAAGRPLSGTWDSSERERTSMSDHLIFEQLAATWRAAGTAAVLSELANYLRAQQRYHELFEARKLLLRQQLDLPLLSTETDDQLPKTSARP